jgi:hypothetical protein
MNWPTDPKKLPDLIDFSVVKNISTNYIKIENGFYLNSDHSPIYLTISDKIITKDQNPVLTNKQTYWDYFNHLLESNINLTVPLKTADQLECFHDCYSGSCVIMRLVAGIQDLITN